MDVTYTVNKCPSHYQHARYVVTVASGEATSKDDVVISISGRQLMEILQCDTLEDLGRISLTEDKLADMIRERGVDNIYTRTLNSSSLKLNTLTWRVLHAIAPGLEAVSLCILRALDGWHDSPPPDPFMHREGTERPYKVCYYVSSPEEARERFAHFSSASVIEAAVKDIEALESKG